MRPPSILKRSHSRLLLVDFFYQAAMSGEIVTLPFTSEIRAAAQVVSVLPGTAYVNLRGSLHALAFPLLFVARCRIFFLAGRWNQSQQ